MHARTNAPTSARLHACTHARTHARMHSRCLKEVDVVNYVLFVRAGADPTVHALVRACEYVPGGVQVCGQSNAGVREVVTRECAHARVCGMHVRTRA